RNVAFAGFELDEKTLAHVRDLRERFEREPTLVSARAHGSSEPAKELHPLRANSTILRIHQVAALYYFSKTSSSSGSPRFPATSRARIPRCFHAAKSGLQTRYESKLE